jgi:hypothetical protein
MAKCIARKFEAHKSKSSVLGFKKDDETGLYKKITQNFIHDNLLNTSKKDGKEVISENNYRISDESNYDHMFEVSGPDNKNVVIYFKEVQD